MSKVIKLFVVLGLLAAAVFVIVQYLPSADEPARADRSPAEKKAEENKPRVEEKYGYTSEGVGS